MRAAPVSDEELRAEVADVPGREVALREDVRAGPVEERRLAIAVAFLERAQLPLRGEGLRLADRAAQPLAGAGDVELEGAQACLAQAGEEAGMVGGEGARLAAGVAACGKHADDEVAAAKLARALFQHARHLAFELANFLQLAQPVRLAREQQISLLVRSRLHQTEGQVQGLVPSNHGARSSVLDFVEPPIRMAIRVVEDRVEPARRLSFLA